MPRRSTIRVGIETGLVVLGPIGGGGRVEYGATGDALNTAARLQSHAPPGRVLVGDVTRRAAGDLFMWGEERRLELKGKAEPVSAFEVIGERREHRRRRSRSVPMVGREREFERASGIAERASGGEGGLLVVVGDPGIGKSRLVEELRGRVSGSAVTWLEGRCVSFGGSTPYLPLRDLILDALELPGADQPSRRRPVAERVRSCSPVISTTPSRTSQAVLGTVGAEDATQHLSPETRRCGRARRAPPVRRSRSPNAVRSWSRSRTSTGRTRRPSRRSALLLRERVGTPRSCSS